MGGTLSERDYVGISIAVVSAVLAGAVCCWLYTLGDTHQWRAVLFRRGTEGDDQNVMEIEMTDVERDEGRSRDRNIVQGRSEGLTIEDDNERWTRIAL